MNASPARHAVMEAAPDPRKFERKAVASKALLVDAEGNFVTDCTIRNLSLLGAQVDLPKARPLPEETFLIDIANRYAYRAHIAWWRPNSAGFAFQEAYALDETLPPQLEFLKGVLLDIQLQDVDALTAQGTSLPDAVHAVGMTGQSYAHGRAKRTPAKDLAERLWELESENASLRKLVSQLSED